MFNLKKNQDTKTEEKVNIITITKVAVDKIKEMAAKEGMTGKAVRLEVIPSGDGIAYNMEFSDEGREGDTVQEDGDLKFLIDAMSKEMLNGATVDFRDSIQGSGFVFDNPNVQASGGGCSGCSGGKGCCG